ncbi:MULTISPECIES: hypothetical protein [Xanthomonas]|uniref:hypothetical protein n=1 Tax=Xanthomonas TaxID=338 RepID=UPI001ADCED06|nr:MULTISPECIES: hypothetical protein [unclassified Xanthomonas]MBO9872825.1 hypothetical protein [Xanthomonas sp. D-93]WNH44954.1 hypothetical protein PG878_00275 [Xanthomonas sp. A6251]
MSSHATTTSNAPTHSASEIAKRVLVLIENIHGRQDISPDAIKKHAGLHIDINPADPNDYGVSGRLTDTWYYALRSMSEEPGHSPSRLLFQFNDQTHSQADMGPICVPFEDYSQALAAAGYTGKRMRNRLGTEEYWDFSRGSVTVTVYPRGRESPKDSQTCVSMVIINVYA